MTSKPRTSLSAGMALLEPVKHKNLLDAGHLNKTQRNALSLLQREDENDKKGRLESLLHHQFIDKYGVKQAHSEVNNAIRECIRDFVGSFVNARDAEPAIPQLEAEIRSKSDAMKNAIRDAKRMEMRIKKEEEARALQQASSKNRPNQPNWSGNPSDILSTLTESDWPTVANVLQEVNEAKAKAAAATAAANKKAKLRAQLDEQLAQSKQREEDERAQKMKALNNVQNSLSSYQSELAAKQAAHEASLATQRALRQEQILLHKQTKSKERDAQLAQEKAQIARAQQQMEEEERAKQAAKDAQRARQDRLLNENELNKRIKEQALREQQDEDKRLMKAYEERLEAEERARANAFQSRMDAMQHFTSSYQSSVGTRLAQQKLEDERLLVQKQAEKDRADLAKEQAKQDARRKRMQASMEENIAMIENKQRVKETERMQALEMRLRLEKEAADARNKQRESEEALRLKRQEMKLDLDAQLRNTRDRKRKEKEDMYSMGASNQEVLKVLEQDPQLMSKVLDRVHMTISSGRRQNNIF